MEVDNEDYMEFDPNLVSIKIEEDFDKKNEDFDEKSEDFDVKSEDFDEKNEDFDGKNEDFDEINEDFDEKNEITCQICNEKLESSKVESHFLNEHCLQKTVSFKKESTKAEKNERKSIARSQKIEIINLRNDGWRFSKIAKFYDMAESSVRTIIKNREQFEDQKAGM